MAASRAKRNSMMIDKHKKPIKCMQAAVNMKTKGPNSETKKMTISKTIRKCHKM